MSPYVYIVSTSLLTVLRCEFRVPRNLDLNLELEQRLASIPGGHEKETPGVDTVKSSEARASQQCKRSRGGKRGAVYFPR